MRRALLLVVVIAAGCAPALRVRTATTPRTLDPRALEGRWYVLVSNFPMWAGDKTDPTFNYAILPGPGPVRLRDVVASIDDGEPDSIEGIDTQDPDVPTHFTWRGTGLLKPFTSDWDLVELADDGSWAVVAFSKTIATPEGVDIIARTPALDPATLRTILLRMGADPRLRERAHGLFHVPHGGVKQTSSLELPASP